MKHTEFCQLREENALGIIVLDKIYIHFLFHIFPKVATENFTKPESLHPPISQGRCEQTYHSIQLL